MESSEPNSELKQPDSDQVSKLPKADSLECLSTTQIVRCIFKYYRTKDFRLVNKFFCKTYDEFDIDFEEFKADDGTQNAERQLYEQIKSYVTDKSISASSYESCLDKPLWKYQKGLSQIKRSYKKLKTDTRCELFDIPLNFYPCIITHIYFKDTQKSLDLEEVAANRNDYDYMKDVRQKIGQGKYMTFKCFNGDIITIHKCLMNLFKHEFDEEVEDDDNTYSFLSDKTKYDSGNVDFTDKGALLKRQKEILADIEAHKKQKESNFSPFSFLKSGMKQWFMILCQGGKFCIAKIQENKIVDHKSDSKYVQRKKAGKRQINFDKVSSCMTSVGSQMRRTNEKLHQEHIHNILEEYKEDLEKADVIYLNAPGVNKMFFIAPGKPLREMRNKIRTLTFSMKKANYTELQKAFEELLELKISFSKD